MRIIYIANGNGLSPHLGGSMIRSASVARELQRFGNGVLLVTTSGGRAAWTGLGFSGEVVEVPCSLGRRFEQGNFDRALAYGISAVLGARITRDFLNYDIVYTDSDYPCDILPALSLRRRSRDTLWVAMVHHLVNRECGVKAGRRDPFAAVKRTAQRWAHRTIARHADAAFVYDSDAGRAVASELRALGFANDSVVSVNNGFSAEALNVAATESQRYDAILIGGLRPGKGASEVVPIWRRVVAARPGSRLGIIGPMTPGLERSFGREAATAGLTGNIDVLGPRPHSETIALLRAASLLFAPSLEEGWGIAVCEALACDKPVVAYDLPAYRTLFPAGLVRTPLGNHNAFAAGVVRLLNDPSERASLGQSGRKAVERFEWKRVSQDDIAAFEQIRRRLRGETL
ncbi:MAG: glycosyltransferase family 4 protein [Vulcanimicrobiaceae bacterium]